MQIVFQDPYASLNPRMTVREIVAEPLRINGSTGRAAARGSRSCCARSASRRSTATASPRVLGRPAAADRHRARARPEPAADRARRAGLRARRLDPRPGDQPARVVQRDFGLTYLFVAHDLSVVGTSPTASPSCTWARSSRSGHASRSTSGRRIRTRRRSCRPCRSTTRRSAASGSGSSSPATCRARPIRLRAAASARAAGRRRRSAAVEEPALIDRGYGQLSACHFAEPMAVLEPGAATNGAAPDRRRKPRRRRPAGAAARRYRLHAGRRAPRSASQVSKISDSTCPCSPAGPLCTSSIEFAAASISFDMALSAPASAAARRRGPPAPRRRRSCPTRSPSRSRLVRRRAIRSSVDSGRLMYANDESAVLRASTTSCSNASVVVAAAAGAEQNERERDGDEAQTGREGPHGAPG